MKKYKKLIVYDFDDTMFKTPGPECYLTVRQLAHDKLPDIKDINQDYYSWWDHPVSLDTGLFQICAITEVLDTYYANRDCKDTMQVLITHRSPELIPSIEYILKKYGISFDSIFANKRSKPKSEYLREILEDHAGIESVIVNEDSLKHIIDYNGMLYNEYRDSRKLVWMYQFVTIPLIFSLDMDMRVIAGSDQQIHLTFK